VARLENYTPPWPLPKIFRLTKSGKLNEGIFKGATINTPSMLCVEDTLKAIEWLNANGGLDFALQTSARNLAIVRNWVAENDWIDFLCEDEANLSSTSICLKITAADFNDLALPIRQEIVKKTIQYLESEYIAYDIGSYRDAPLGLRLWGGATVTNDDMEALLPWITWTFKKILSEYITNQN
jgi:phosphoserine aminotransferase